MYKIRLALELNEESGVYTVTSPDVPGLVTEGATPQEINRNAEEALQGLLEVWADLGMELPATLRNAQASPKCSSQSSRKLWSFREDDWSN